MPICRKCNANFPNLVKIDGKRRNLSSRRYCLDCSPFDQHNTKNFEKSIVLQTRKRKQLPGPCKLCGLDRKKQPGTATCYVCLNKKREKEKGDKVYGIVGEACWKCGYDKDRTILDFHHVMGKKDFGLTRRNIGQLSWSRIYAEMQKCVLLCSRCHREVHAGLISIEEVLKLFTRWNGRID